MIDKIEQALVKIRQEKPLILCLTNFVTVEFVANSLLSLGATPIMSSCKDELDELVKISSALYINIGTLDDDFMGLAKQAIDLAKQHQKPIIFDPVGSGATVLRTEASKFIVPFANVIRGNSSEIISLYDATQSTHGVDAKHTTDEAVAIAERLSLDHHAVVMVSGPVDFITDGHQSARVPFGSPLMQKVTGMGCSLTAVIGAFQAVIKDPFEATLIAAHYFGLCGEVASKKNSSPGSFKIGFLDELYDPDFVNI